jgi:hypothetical protein
MRSGDDNLGSIRRSDPASPTGDLRPTSDGKEHTRNLSAVFDGLLKAGLPEE